MAAGKGGRRDGGAFSGCHAVRHPAKKFFIFIFLKNTLPGAT
jgi:hypothetical protein